MKKTNFVLGLVALICAMMLISCAQPKDATAKENYKCEVAGKYEYWPGGVSVPGMSPTILTIKEDGLCELSAAVGYRLYKDGKLQAVVADNYTDAGTWEAKGDKVILHTDSNGVKQDLTLTKFKE